MQELPDGEPDAASLLSLAGWYRSWAEVANSEQDRADRLSFAEHLETLARKAGRADPAPSSPKR